MKYYVLADEDTVLGFAFAGVGGTVVQTPDQARDVFREKVNDPEIGVLIMTEEAVETVGDEVNQVLYQASRPMIVRIPGPGGPLAQRRSLQQLIQEAVGIKL